MIIYRGKDWTGEYITDFSKLLPGMRPKEDVISSSLPQDDEGIWY